MCRVKEDNKNEAHSDDFYKELLINPLTDIANKADNELNNFEPFEGEAFANYRFPEEVKVDGEAYCAILGRRKDQIDCVINSHLYKVHGEVKYKVDGWNEKDTSEKLDELFQRQQALQQEGEEVDNSARLRLSALIQSYDMFNSEQFLAIKPIKELLEASNN